MRDPASCSPGRRPALLVALLLLVTACGLRPRPADAPDGSREHIITAEMIEESGARTIWHALQIHVKHTFFTEDGYGTPQRVRRRGASTIALIEDMPIFLDDIRINDVTILEDMPAAEIERIRVLSGIDATTYYGTGAGDGVILIYTKTD